LPKTNSSCEALVTAEIVLDADALCAEKAAEVIIESAKAEPE